MERNYYSTRPTLQMHFYERVTPSPAPTNDFQIISEIHLNQKIAKHIKK
jgi:hypothetical protein